MSTAKLYHFHSVCNYCVITDLQFGIQKEIQIMSSQLSCFCAVFVIPGSANAGGGVCPRTVWRAIPGLVSFLHSGQDGAASC